MSRSCWDIPMLVPQWMFTLTQRGKQSEILQDFWIRLQGNKQRIEISPVLLRNLIIVIFCYQISHKLLKTLRLWQVSFPLYVPLCYIIPPVFTDSGKGKSKGTRCPVDICSVPTEAAAETNKSYNTVWHKMELTLNKLKTEFHQIWISVFFLSSTSGSKASAIVRGSVHNAPP